MLYLAAFDIVAANAIHSFGTITLSTAGESDVVLTLGDITANNVDNVAGATTFWVWSSSDYYVQDQSPFAYTRFAHFSESTWAKAVDTALKAEAVTQGWAAKIPSCTWSSATGFYTFAVATVNSAVAWSASSGRALFGFSGNSATAASHVGTIMPMYVISPTLGSVSDPTLNYEPSAIGNRVAADNGAGFGLARRVSPLHRDWRQEYETKEKTMRLQAAAAHPWTFQHLFEHCRGRFPFLVYDGGFHDTETFPEAFTFRDDGIAFVPERATPGNDAQLHIPFRCVVEGTLAAVPA